MTIFLMATIASMSQNNTDRNFRSGYAPVNGLHMYYEVHGSGKPLVLIHGSYMNIELNYSQLIPELARHHQVIACEIQGHGRTADIERPYSFAHLADDVAGLLQYLNIERADILGYSLGGTIALEFGIRHPELTDRIVFISSAYKYEGWVQAARDIFPTIVPEFFEQTPLKTDYDRLAPDPSHWKEFVHKLAHFDATPFDLGAENIRAMAAPMLIINGDNDGVELDHIIDLYRLCGGGVFADMTGLPKSRLAIIPAAGHVSLMMETEKLLALILPFLNTEKGN